MPEAIQSGCANPWIATALCGAPRNDGMAASSPAAAGLAMTTLKVLPE